MEEIKLNKTLTKKANKLARLLQREYADYYLIDGVVDTFNGEFAYIYLDIMGSDHLVEVRPWEYKDRHEILNKNAKKCAFYIGFPIPWYE